VEYQVLVKEFQAAEQAARREAFEEIRRLREDKERLDWLEKKLSDGWKITTPKRQAWHLAPFRQAIDDAREAEGEKDGA
jgi:hypothetical protein